MRTLMWLNLVAPLLLAAAFSSLLLQSGGAQFEPARLSDATAFVHWSGVFQQLANAVVPIVALVVAHVLAYRAARTRSDRQRRLAKAWCLGVVVFVVLYVLQAGTLGAFDRLTIIQAAGCLLGLAAMVAVCALDVVKFWNPLPAGKLAPTPGFEPGTR